MSEQPKTWVTREEFAAGSRELPSIDLEAFRADQDAAIDHEAMDRYDLWAPEAEG